MFFSEIFCWELSILDLGSCIEILTLDRSLLGISFLCKMRGDLQGSFQLQKSVILY